jgi:hypothetical protein
MGLLSTKTERQMMAKLTGWAVSVLDKVVRQFRTEVEERATKIAEDRGDTEATLEDVMNAVPVVIESRFRPAKK